MKAGAVWAPIVLLACYWACLSSLSRAVVNEDWDGIKSVSNALLLSGGGSFGVFDGKRPPAGWLLAAPVLSGAYRRGGPEAALRACRYLMPGVLAALLWVSHRLFLRRFSSFSASLAVFLMALNPMLIQFSPFALFDIFSALALLPFLACAYRYLERRDARSFASLAAAYLLAFLSKYHLGMMILVPLACLGPRGILKSPLWLLPAACWAASALALGGLIFWVTGGDRHAWSQGWLELWANLSFNVLTSKASHWHLYLETLGRQLGPGLGGLALMGVWSWTKGARGGDLFLAWALAVPLLALSFGIANKEARYAIPCLPLLYAAIAQGLDFALERLPRARYVVLTGTLMLVPWSESLAAARFLLREPAVHTRVPWELGRLVAAEVPPSGCVAWTEGDILFPIATPLYRYEWSLILGAPTFGFFAQRRVVELKEGQDAAPGCEARLTVVPRVGPKGERWTGGPAARVYRASKGLAAEVYPDRLQERPAP